MEHKVKEPKEGDSFLFDGELWEVLTVYSTMYTIQNITTKENWAVNHEFMNHVLNLPNPRSINHVHNMNLYQGFTDTYRYCTECNYKEKTQ